jgi:hypothetical protein
MKPILNLYFTLILTVYILIRLVEYFLNVHLGCLSNYATDLCCMPIVLSILWFALIKLKKKEMTLPFLFVGMITLGWSLYFEYYLPTKSVQFTSDWIDVVCYSIGAGSFLTYQKYHENKSLALKLK